MTHPLDYDVVVIGAGSAGAAAAGFLAKDGRKVALLESRRWVLGGARWVDDVPPWMLDRAGVPRPSAPAKRCDHVPITLLSCSAGTRVQAGLRPMWGLDMPAFGQSLRDSALEAGVAGFERVELLDVVEDGNRPSEVRIRGRRLGEVVAETRLRARLFVDASGLSQALLRRVALSTACPAVDASDLCSATQQLRDVEDREAAVAFVHSYGAGPGHVLSFMGVRGGYSSFMVRLEPDGDHVELLAGVIDDGEHGTGTELVGEFVRHHAWVGKVVAGGAGRIPLRRPYDRLSSRGLALVGDAGCQTFPAHGSGVGSGLVAARILAEAVRGHDDPGGDGATWGYQAAFQRERGGVNAAYDVFRRATQALNGASLEALMEAGLIEAGASRAALDQRIPSPSFADVMRMAWSASKVPQRAGRLLASALRMPMIERWYATYPTAPDERALRNWAATAARLCGHRADVA